VVGHTAKERGMVTSDKGLTLAGFVENKTQVRGNVCQGHPFYCTLLHENLNVLNSKEPKLCVSQYPSCFLPMKIWGANK
jgi:hypothetical protein